MTMFNNTAAPATSNGNEASGSGLTSGLTSAASGVGLAQQQLRNKKVPVNNSDTFFKCFLGCFTTFV